MNDTPSDMDRRMTELFMSRTAGERVRAACEMFDCARVVMTAGIRSDHPHIDPVELRVKIFERTYGNDFNPVDRARIITRLRAAAD